MSDLHEMSCTGQTTSEAVFACDACGRRVVVGKTEPRFVVIDRGDLYARHVGGLGGMAVGLVVGGR